ncbi:tetratricopeptide repeat protein [Myxococcus faecalis]|uniref:serine/threonine-protein kinase n=1 Tax=Myxococcus faecalis TaxID=3115646 RepID=UPI003CF68874
MSRLHTSTPCPDEGALADLVEGLVTGSALARLEQHLDGCARCRQLVVVLAGDEDSRDRLQPRLAPGARVGRYVLLEHIGLGSMGVVFAAYDPELDRKVALKLLRPDWDAGPGATEARARLSREAQALARLSHPHVVAVHDVGGHDDGLFIAMDFVAGTTLRKWLKAAPRPWTDVLECFLQAGRGLQAAHARGLVHRDFKPDNVLVGLDGRVRVTDFGLARLVREPEPLELSTGTAAPRGPSVEVTQDGALLGTVAYMSPEQLEGRPADARGDQFSFCIALVEALCGERPFRGSTPRELHQAILAGTPSLPLPSRVPSRVRRALLRGLSADPFSRHPSMEALLSALTHTSRWMRWRWMMAGACATAVLGVATGFWLREATRCAGVEGRRAVEWSEQRRARLVAALESASPRLSEQARDHTLKRLGAYVDSLVAMERESCEATHVRGEQSERMLDLRGACLSRRWGSLGATVELLSRADPAVLEAAPRAVHALPDILPCADRVALASVVPPPASAQARARLEKLRLQLAESTALHEARQEDAAMALTQQVLQGAREVGHRPDESAALLVLGYIEGALGHYDKSWEAFRASQRAALAGRDDEMLVRSLTGMVSAELNRKDRHEEAGHAAEMAEAALERMDTTLTPSAASEFHATRGLLRFRKGAYDAALEDLRAAVAIREKSLGAEHPLVAHPLSTVGIVLNAQGRYAEALASHERALGLLERAYGTEHLGCIEYLNNVATSLRLLGRVEEAVARYSRALKLAERLPHDEHPRALMVRLNLGDALQRQGKLSEALAHYARVLPDLKRIHGEAHPRVVSVLTSMGNAHADLGQSASAEQAYGEALALQRRYLGDTHPDLALTYNNLGTVKLDLGAHAEARSLLLTARKSWEQSLGTEHPKVASVIQNLAKVDLAEGRLPAALHGFLRALELRRKALGREHPRVVVTLTLAGDATRRLRGARASLELLEEAVALAGKVELAPVERGMAEFALARALWEVGEEQRPRALTLAREAQRRFEQDPLGAAKERGALDAWLAAPARSPRSGGGTRVGGSP